MSTGVRGPEDRFYRLKKKVFRQLTALGSFPAEDVKYDLTGLPLGGRMRLTASRQRPARTALWNWLLEHEERRHWQALAFPMHGTGRVIVQLTLEDFAHVVGKLSRYEMELERISGDQQDHSDR